MKNAEFDIPNTRLACVYAVLACVYAANVIKLAPAIVAEANAFAPMPVLYANKFAELALLYAVFAVINAAFTFSSASKDMVLAYVNAAIAIVCA